MPSGLSFARFDAFGMYTRLPSGPFALRPALTSATAGTTHWPPSQTGVEKLYPVIASNLPFGSGDHGRLASPAHLPTSARFRARAPGPLSGQLCKGPRQEN